MINSDNSEKNTEDISSDWEIKSLSELGTFLRGITYKAEDVKDSGNIVLRSTNIQEGRVDMSPEILQFLSKEVPEVIRLIDGDIVICRTNGSKRLVGKSAVFRSTDKTHGKIITVGDFCSILRPENPIVSLLMQTDKYKKEIDLLLAGSAINSIKNSDVGKIKFKIPKSLSEQKNIAEFFTLLDRRIELQSEKVDALKEYKKGIQQKIFSRELVFKDDNGNNYPEWGEKKLGSIITTGKAGGTPKATQKSYYHGDIPFLGISDMTSQGKYLDKTSKAISQSGLENSSAWIVPSGYLIYAMYASVGKLAINNIPMATSQAMYSMTFDDNTDIQYIYYYLDGLRDNGLEKYITTGTQGNINKETLRSFEIPYPCKEEQEKISSLLSKIDEKIDKEKEKVELLKEQKKGYLQKMFV